MGARAGRNRADAAVGGDGEKKTAAFLMRSGPLRTIGGGGARHGLIPDDFGLFRRAEGLEACKAHVLCTKANRSHEL